MKRTQTNIADLTEVILRHIPPEVYTLQNLKVTDEWVLLLPNHRPIRLPIFWSNGPKSSWQWQHKIGFLVELEGGNKRYADTFEMALRISQKRARV